MTKHWDERRERVLKCLRLAEFTVQLELEESAPDDPERVSIAGALESVRAAALYLEPVKAEPC